MTFTNMIRMTFILISMSLLNISCKQSAPFSATRSGLTSFGSGDEILIEVFDKALADYYLEHAELSWSGSGGSDEFSAHDSLTVRNSDIKSVADKLDKELDGLPQKRGWTTHGSGRTGDRFLRLNYEEDDAQFYMDFILTQKGKNVEIYVLYKGIKR